MDNQRCIELIEPLSKRCQRRGLDIKYQLLGSVSRFLVASSISSALNHARIFCSFVGHGRSGGSLVGALLNAHPNVIMSNELNAFRRIRLGIREDDLYRLIYIVSKRQVSRGSRGGGGYNYAVPGQWQGSHREILVIGDRKAGASSQELTAHPEILELLDRRIRLTKRFVHVVRNPLDTIATTVKKTLRGRSTTEVNHLEREILNYFARCQAVKAVELHFGCESVHYLHHEDLISEPHEALADLCRFLALEASADYLNACAGILMQSPHKTRTSVNWRLHHLRDIRNHMRQFSWLKRYQSTF
jgi:hypothetical protein